MKVSRNAFYNWLKTKDIDKESPTLKLLKLKIKNIYYSNRQVYGSVRVQKQLKREGIYYSRSYVAVLMREMGLKSVIKKKYTRTTDSNHDYPISENILNRDFSCNELGKKWVSDITYIRVNNKWNYLTTIIDLADRKVIGWSLSEDMTTKNTVCRAWINATNNRKIKSGFVFHSDRGVQYASKLIRDIMGENIYANQSMSRKGDCWDNAVAESFFKTIKYECLYLKTFKYFNQLYYCIEEYMEWYNNRRLHSALDFKTPREMEIELEKLTKNVA